jgi:hypothetical protein
MAKLRVTLIDEVRNRRLKVDLPDDAAIEKLLPALAKKLDLPPADYQLTHEPTGRALGGDQSLASFGLREGDALRLAAVREEAPVVPWLAEEEAVPIWQKVPVWGWALGALVVLATVAIAFILRLTPDGAILFTSDRDGKREVYRLTGAGEVTQITHTPGNGESWSPASAPDGAILFTSDRDGKREVYRLTGTGEVVQITHTPGDDESWSPVR